MTVRQQVPATEAVTYVEFALSDSTYPFVAASADAGGQTLLEEIIPRGEKGCAEFFTVLDTAPDRVLSLAADHDSVEAELLSEYDDGGLFEFVVAENCPAVFLSEQGALPRQVESAAGEGYIAAEIPAEKDASSVIDSFLAAHPDAELVVKRQQPYTTPMFSHREFQDAIEDRLTPRQQEVLTAAHSAGYYEWPRRTSGEDLAENLDISPPTLHEHLRTAEQKLIAAFFKSPTP